VEYYLALGKRRAKEATKHLVELGIDKKKIKTINYGKGSPFAPGYNEEVWTKKRDCFVIAHQQYNSDRG